MGLFGFVAGLFAANKIHDKIDENKDDSFLEDAFETDISRAGGSVVEGIVDTLLGESSDDEDEDDEDDY